MLRYPMKSLLIGETFYIIWSCSLCRVLLLWPIKGSAGPCPALPGNARRQNRPFWRDNAYTAGSARLSVTWGKINSCLLCLGQKAIFFRMTISIAKHFILAVITQHCQIKLTDMYAFLLSLSLLAKESRTPFMQTGMCSRGCAMGLTDILHRFDTKFTDCW